MKTKTFNFCVMFGLQTRLQFECNTPVVNNGKFDTIMQLDGDGMIVPNGCIATIDFQKNRIGLSYGQWIFAFDLLSKNEVDGNYHFKCTNDFCRADIYICESDLWKERGETIFY